MSIDYDDPNKEVEGQFKFSLLFLDDLYQSFVKDRQGQLLISTLTILLLLIILTMTLFFMIMCSKSTGEKSFQQIHSNYFYKFISCILVIFSRLLYIPILDVTLRNAHIGFDRLNENIFLVCFILNIIILIIYVILVFYSKVIFKLTIVNGGDHIVPWNRPNSSMVYFEFLAKVLNTAIIAIDQYGKFIYIEIIVSFILQILYISMSIMFVECFSRNLRIIQKMFQALVILILEIGVIKYILHTNDGKDGIYLVVMAVFQCGFIYFIKQYRQVRLMNLYKAGHLKIEMDIENLLLVFLELTQDAIHELNSNSTYYFSQILFLINEHALTCKSTDCFCHHIEQFTNVFKEHYKQGSNIISLSSKEYKQVKKLMKNKQVNKYFNGLNKMYCDEFITKKEQRNQRVMEEDEILINIDENQALKHTNVKTFKIDVMEFKKKLITVFFMTIFQEIRQKFTNSIKIHNMFNFYSMFIYEKPQLCISKLRGSDFKNLSWLETISNYMNEYYLLYHFENYEQRDQSQEKKNFDGDHFIKINNLYQEFHQKVESLSQNAIDFWRGFVTNDIDPYSSYEIGSKMATDINLLYQKFQQIEDALLSKDYKIYLWFAMIQQKIMNDQDGYQIFMNKMKEILNMNKLFKNNIKLSSNKLTTSDIEESGFIVVDGKVQNQGQILFMNKQLKKWLQRFTNDEVRFLNIKGLMPKLIAENHDKFFAKYNLTGNSIMFNRKVVNFLKTKNSAIFPVEMLIKFHYSQKYNYCFVGLIHRIKELSPFRDGLKYHTNQLVFLTIDWNTSQIYEASENFLDLLRLQGINTKSNISQVSFTEKVITLEEILINFKFNDMKIHKNKKQNKSQHLNVYEDVHQLYLQDFNDEIDGRSFNQKSGIRNHVKVAIFHENYSQGEFQMGFVVLYLMSESMNQTLKQKAVADTFQAEERILHDEEKFEELEERDGSQASSSVGSSTSSFNNIQQFHAFYKQQTPRILKIVIQMILLMFTISLAIATLNLGLIIKNQIQTSFNIYQIREAFERINLTVTNRLMLRVLLNIANGYEKNSNDLIEDRFSKYMKMQAEHIQELKETQYYLENSGYQFSGDFMEIRNTNNIQLSYIKENGKIYKENQTMRVSQNLFQSRLLQINSFNRSQFIGRLYLQTLNSNKTMNFTPTTEEELIYFTVYNGNGVIREYVIIFEELYFKDNQFQVEQSQKQNEITAILSIATIIIVAFIVSPIISKTEERKFNALSFFLKINKEEVQLNLQKCEECLNYEEDQASKKRLSTEVKQTKFQDQQEDQPELEVEAEKADSHYFDNSIQVDESIMVPSQARYLISGKQMNTVKNLNTVSLQVQNSQRSQRSSVSFMSNRKLLSTNLVVKKRTRDNIDVSVMDDLSQDQDQSIDQEESPNNDRRLESIQIQLGKEGRSLGSLSKAQDQNQEKEKQQSQLEQQLKQIKKIGFRNKIKSFFFVMTISIIFCIYFVITFFMGKNNYDQAIHTIEHLGIIYGKDSCFENSMVFMRENQIRNESVVLTEDPSKVASSTVLEDCLLKEHDYRDIRREYPDYFNEAKAFIDKVESKDLCDTVFVDENAYLNQKCKIAYNGALNKGLTPALFIMQNCSYIQIQVCTCSEDLNGIRPGIDIEEQNCRFLEKGYCK